MGSYPPGGLQKRRSRDAGRWARLDQTCFAPDRVYTRGPMSKICHVCAKGPSFGNNRSHSMVATRRRFDPNLQRVRIDDGGTPRRVYVCTRCLKAGKIVKAR